MANQTFRTAPRLYFSEPKDDRCGSDNFYMLPQELMTAVMSGITGNCLNQLKLMILLLGTKEGFALSEDFVLKKLRITQQAYLKARKALVEKHWISIQKKPHQIIVHIDQIWEDYYEQLRHLRTEKD